MPEIEIRLDEFFRLASPSKNSKLCRVYRCLNLRKSDRSLCAKHDSQIYRARNPVRYAFTIIRQRAERKKIPFLLEFEEFRSFIADSGYMENKGVKPDNLHVDRIDASRGYLIGNLQIIPAHENCSKGHQERGREIIDEPF